MDSIYSLTVDFLKGKIDIQKYKQKLLAFSEIADGNRSGNTSLSFLSSAIEEINCIGSFEEDNNLRLQALICDIFNNFAHSMVDSKTKNVGTDEIRTQAFGLKKYLVWEIIRECRKTNNKSYGLVEQQGKNENIFVVDIPGCGQIKWHFPKYVDIKSQKYPLKIEDNYRNLTNKNLILQEKTTSEIKKLSAHNQTVISTFDVEEMNNALGLNIPLITELQQQINPPTIEEIEQPVSNQEITKSVNLQVE